MIPTDSLAQAVSESQKWHYDYAELQRLLSGFPDVPWETPAELDHSKFGLCRDFSLWTCYRTLELCPEAVVRIVMGLYTKTDPACGHAWVEIVPEPLGEDLFWADPTFDSGPQAESWYSDRVPWESWRWDGHGFVEPVRYEREGQDAAG